MPGGDTDLLLPRAWTELKPNSITLAYSKLVRSWSQTGSKLVADQLRTSFESAKRNGIWLLAPSLRMLSDDLFISKRSRVTMRPSTPFRDKQIDERYCGRHGIVSAGRN